MFRFFRHWRAFVLALLLSPGVQAGDIVVYETNTSFDDVLTALKLGIEDRGLLIKDVSHIGEMLARTAKDLGDGHQAYVRAASVEFCSATLSRQMTNEDPTRLINCPFIIAVYTVPERPDTTFVVHRAIPEEQVAASPAMRAVAEMLHGLAEGAVNW